MTVNSVTTSNKRHIGGADAPDGKVFGYSADDKIAFFGGTPSIQVTITTIATAATIATAVLSIQAIIAELQSKGLVS